MLDCVGNGFISLLFCFSILKIILVNLYQQPKCLRCVFTTGFEIQKSKNAALNNLRESATRLPFDLVQVAKLEERSLQSLEDHLTERSYVSGFEPTTSDNLVFEALSNVSKLDAKVYPSIHRWHKHIESYGSDRNKFPVTMTRSLTRLLSRLLCS